jgi:Mn2+/Fe2+ NRAMP family transporter
VRRGVIDSVVGIAMLGILTMVLLSTAAAVLHGSIEGAELRSAGDVARVLEPAFGPAAGVLFSAGLLAGAFSSFLVNAMIGGTVLSDGLGLGADLNGKGPRVLTTVALLGSMAVAAYLQSIGKSPMGVIFFAQALTVLGNPVLAGVLLWLSIRPGTGRSCPRWMQVLAAVGFVVVLVLACRTGMRLALAP